MRAPVDTSLHVTAAVIAGDPPSAGVLERLLEQGTARLDSAALHFKRGRLALLRLGFVSVGVLALVFWSSHEIGLHGGRLWQWSLLPGALLCAASVLIYALRFQCVMRVFDVRLGTVQALRISTLGLFYQCFLPLSAGGDLTKFIKLRGLAPGNRLLFTASGIVFDHALGLACLLLMAAVLALTRPAVRSAIDPATALFALLLVVLLAWLLVHRFVRPLTGRDAVVARLFSHKRNLLVALALSLLMQCLTAAAVYAGSRGWHIEIGYFDVLFVLTVSFVVQAIPFNLVGVGAADVAGAALYIALGLPPAAAVLLVSLLYIYRLLTAALGGLWDLVPS